MKRIVLAGLFLYLSYNVVFSQGIRANEDPDNLFYLATEQFHEKEYPSCYRTIGTWLKKSESPSLIEEASFLQAASAYELNKRETSTLLIHFLEKYPSSPHSPKMYYFLGCCALNARQYKDASEFFQHCSENDFAEKELNDFRFRVAYVSLLMGDSETARKMFGKLMNGENRYVGSATYFSAYIDYTERKMKDAMIKFNKISDHSQYKNAVPYFNLQLLYLDGQYDKMLDQAEQLLTKNPALDQKTELNRLMGAAWFSKKNYILSQKYYKDYLSLNPQIRRPDFYRMGVNNYISKNYNEAIDYLLKVNKSDDALFQSATYHLGLCYLEQNKKDLARTNFQQASLSDFDKSTKEKALYNYALLNYETSFLSFNDQIKAFRLILDDFPKSEFKDNVDGYLANMFLSSKNYEFSLSEIQKIALPNQKLLQAKGQLLFLMGIDKYNNKFFRDASDLFSQSINAKESLSLSASESYFWRGEAYYQLHQMDAASKDFKNVINNPDTSKTNAYPIVLYDLGYCYFNSKNYTEALKWYEKYVSVAQIKHEKTYADALNRIGDCYFQAVDYTKAMKYYQNADLNSSGGNDYANYQKSLIFGLRKEYNSKINILNSFETRFPQSNYADDALFEMGKTYEQMRKPDKAIIAYNHLISAFKESLLSPKAGIQVALLYSNQGKNEDAIATYKKVAENYPNSPEAQIALNNLKVIGINKDTIGEEKNDTLLSNAAEPLPSENSLADSVQSMAEATYADKDYSKALAYYEKIETLSTNSNILIKAKIGELRCLHFLNKNKEAIATADLLISNSDLSEDLLRESKYYRAISLLNSGQKEKAKIDLNDLSIEAQTVYGAEARYRLADYYFEQGNLKESEKLIQLFIKEGTSQSYWLAISYILLADINIKQKNDYQAKQYLLSLKENYTVVDDIQEMISRRLSAIAKRSK